MLKTVILLFAIGCALPGVAASIDWLYRQPSRNLIDLWKGDR